MRGPLGLSGFDSSKKIKGKKRHILLDTKGLLMQAIVHPVDVQGCDAPRGFAVLPVRWVVERAFAWFNRCRRPAKDFESGAHKALTLLKLALIRLMRRKLSDN